MRTWKFYYIKNNGQRIEVITKNCIKPARTKVWKELNVILNNKSIKSVGYEVI